MLCFDAALPCFVTCLEWSAAESFTGHVRRHTFGRAAAAAPADFQSCDAAQTPDEKEALAAIKEAYELGINFWDTAPFYGSGSAERVRPGCIAAVLDRVCAWYAAACTGEYHCL